MEYNNQENTFVPQPNDYKVWSIVRLQDLVYSKLGDIYPLLLFMYGYCQSCAVNHRPYEIK